MSRNYSLNKRSKFMRKTLFATVLATSLALSYDTPKQQPNNHAPRLCTYATPCYDVQ